MKILLFGKNGQLGWELQRTLATLGDVVAVDVTDLDLNQPSAVEGFLRSQKPALVVNASAYTAVDRAEEERAAAFAINCTAPGIMASEAKRLGAAFIHFSTDYVFDGTKNQPYVETDAPNPLNVYGESKRAGEEAIQSSAAAYLIFRTAWVYSMRGETFVNKTLRWARQNPFLRVVDDQVSNPTWARMLAEVIAQLIIMGKNNLSEWVEQRRGIYHLAGEGYATRFAWAQEMLKNLPPNYPLVASNIHAAKTAEFPTPAQRPLFSALETGHFQRTFGLCLPDWRLALRLAMQDGSLGV